MAGSAGRPANATKLDRELLAKSFFAPGSAAALFLHPQQYNVLVVEYLDQEKTQRMLQRSSRGAIF